jgi:NAD(P)-dependent dehydrogenase (short-subunit alcohol dehydrogenase family)
MFAEKGTTLVVNGRLHGRVEETAAELSARGADVLANIADVSTESGGNSIVLPAAQSLICASDC